jgi:hypothetical protein
LKNDQPLTDSASWPTPPYQVRPRLEGCIIGPFNHNFGALELNFNFG